MMTFVVLVAAVAVVLAVSLLVLLVRKKNVELISTRPESVRPPSEAPSRVSSSPRRVAPPNESIESLARSGRLLEAIRRYREQHRVGLREAKEAVEAMVRGVDPGLPSKGAVLRQVKDADIEAQIRTGHLLDAIKLYREKTGVGLKEAKDAVEAWRDRMRAS